MPISSGANSWPASYWHKPAPKQPNTKLVVVDTGRSPSPTQIRRPSPPPSPVQRAPPPPPPPPETDVMIVEHRSPPPSEKIIMQNLPPPPMPHPPPPPHQKITYYNQPPPPSQSAHLIYSKSSPYPPPPRPPPHQTRYVGHGYGGYREYSYPPYGGGGGMCGGDMCCMDSYFSTTGSGANTGCCQGGMFGSRSYPYSMEQNYMLKGTGRGRCCACIWGLLLGLLLLGTLIGLLAGLLPALKKKSAQKSVVNQFANGYWLNGVYYYQITNPPDIFYWAMGPGIPCNPYNNNTIVSPTVSYNTRTMSSTVVTQIITQAPQVTLPNCNSIVTSYVLAKGVSVSTTTINPFMLLTSSSSALYAKAFATLFAAVFVRLCVG